MKYDTTNLILVELTLRVSAIKSLLVKKGIFTDEEFDAEIEIIQAKVVDVFKGTDNLTSDIKPSQLN